MRALVGLVAIAILAGGCKGKPAPADLCRSACDHLVGLSMADLERNATLDADPETAAALRRESKKATEAGVQRCVQKCREGTMEPRCVLAATTLEEAMSPACGKATARPLE